MPELIAPTTRLRDAWLACHREWPGAGPHEDGFALSVTDEVSTEEGFAGWVALRNGKEGHLPRWIVEDGRVLGGIALSYQPDGSSPPMGHLGFGIRPSARRRGLAGWALQAMLPLARIKGIPRVRLLHAPGNTASMATILRAGGVPDGTTETRLGPAATYWIAT